MPFNSGATTFRLLRLTAQPKRSRGAFSERKSKCSKMARPSKRKLDHKTASNFYPDQGSPCAGRRRLQKKPDTKFDLKPGSEYCKRNGGRVTLKQKWQTPLPPHGSWKRNGLRICSEASGNKYRLPSNYRLPSLCVAPRHTHDICKNMVCNLVPAPLVARMPTEKSDRVIHIR